MKILIIANPHIAVPPRYYGGAERIVALYAQEFTRLGHRVDLLAGPGSIPFGGKLHTYQAPSNSFLSRARRKLWFQAQSLLAARDCDVVLNFGRVDYLQFLLRTGKPILFRFGNPIFQSEIDFIERHSDGRSLAVLAVSHSQLRQVKTCLPSYVIHNFFDQSKISQCNSEGKNFCFVGRLTKNKGIDIAIRVAIAMGIPLDIAGHLPDAEHDQREFYDNQVRPYFEHPLITYHGQLDEDSKNVLISSSKALLFPNRWSEPCANVIIESLSHGTPVLALCNGCSPELIAQGIDGFVCKDEEALKDSINKINLLNRSEIRRRSVERFSSETASKRCLDILEQLRHQSFKAL